MSLQTQNLLTIYQLPCAAAQRLVALAGPWIFFETIQLYCDYEVSVVLVMGIRILLEATTWDLQLQRRDKQSTHETRYRACPQQQPSIQSTTHGPAVFFFVTPVVLGFDLLLKKVDILF